MIESQFINSMSVTNVHNYPVLSSIFCPKFIISSTHVYCFHCYQDNGNFKTMVLNSKIQTVQLKFCYKEWNYSIISTLASKIFALKSRNGKNAAENVLIKRKADFNSYSCNIMSKVAEFVQKLHVPLSFRLRHNSLVLTDVYTVLYFTLGRPSLTCEFNIIKN